MPGRRLSAQKHTKNVRQFLLDDFRVGASKIADIKTDKVVEIECVSYLSICNIDAQVNVTERSTADFTH